MLQWKNKKTTGGPIPEKIIVNLLNFLFPDAEGDKSVRQLITNEPIALIRHLEFTVAYLAIIIYLTTSFRS